jgi:hypothetical protein
VRAAVSQRIRPPNALNEGGLHRALQVAPPWIRHACVFDVLEGTLDSERRHLLLGPSGERADEPLRRGVTLQPSERQNCCAVSGKQVHSHVATFVGEVLDALCGEIVVVGTPQRPSRKAVRRSAR